MVRAQCSLNLIHISTVTVAETPLAGEGEVTRKHLLPLFWRSPQQMEDDAVKVHSGGINWASLRSIGEGLPTGVWVFSPCTQDCTGKSLPSWMVAVPYAHSWSSPLLFFVPSPTLPHTHPSLFTVGPPGGQVTSWGNYLQPVGWK